MRLFSPWSLLFCLASLVVVGLLLFRAARERKARAAFGEGQLVDGLRTSDPSKRRAVKGVLLVLSTLLVFGSLARPQCRRGERLVPATNLDVVLVVDFSKSMYARDVAPSRIARAKAEIAKLIHDLPGARFAAVAFAGEAIGFPLTSDGAAIAQFLRQNEPNDMPVGGTAIGRALERGRDILERDPRAKDHRRVMVLVTDGEDTETDPVPVARSLGADHVTVHVVQIGGRSPERIPEVGPDGQIIGWRRDEQGRPLTTELSADGEAQLAKIAEVTGGKIVRSEKGQTGIELIAAQLRSMMTVELREKVEKVFEDEYHWVLGAGLLLLLVESFLGDARKRKEPARA